MAELVVFDIDSLKSLQGFDRLLAREGYRQWRCGERKKDRIAYNKSRWGLYRATHVDVIRRIKERYNLAQKRKKYIRNWFLMADKYVKG